MKYKAVWMVFEIMHLRNVCPRLNLEPRLLPCVLSAGGFTGRTELKTGV